MSYPYGGYAGDVPIDPTENVAEAGLAPKFHADAALYSKKTVVGTLLTLLTLGIYRAWFTTNLRRYLWENTEFDQDNFEYHGTGKELLIGFFIAVAVTLPLIVGPQLAATFLADSAPQLISLLGLYYIVFLYFVQYAIYRGRAYRLSRTSWRGIRFSQSGSGWKYARISFAWILLTLITLGIAYPWLRAAQVRYRVNNTWFGNVKAEFHGKGWDLGKHYFKALACTMAIGFIYGFLTWSPELVQIGLGQLIPGLDAPVFISSIISIILAIVSGYALMFYFCIPYIVAREFRAFTNRIQLGNAHATSSLKARKIFMRALAYIFVTFILLIILMLISVMFIKTFGTSFDSFDFRANLESTNTTSAFWNILVGGIVYLIFIMVNVFVYARVFRFPLIAHMVTSLIIFDHDKLIAAAGPQDGTTGVSAGIADAIDVEFGF